MKAQAEVRPELGISRPLPSSQAPVGRPPRGFTRFLIAYFVTFRIVLSYLSLKVQSRFRSPASLEGLTRKKNLRNARRIHRTISRLQGLFIKVGQLISIMTNFLPEEFRAELEGLQDQVPPRPYADIERRLREELGKPPGELFVELEERPVASASIGQVHRARLPSGEAVAVKVQYPDIEEIVRIDLRALKRIFRVISWFVPYKGLDGIYREIRDMILTELDFHAEADNVEKIAAHFLGRRDVAFPAVRRELSTGRVLTTDWIDGVKVSDRTRLVALGVDRGALARKVVTAYCQQIFTDGVYHADPHPGNLMVKRAPSGEVTVVFIDFGAVAEVSP
ncbi:MAG: ABC1 kinase family protein, partial [Polyangia bacterium]